SHPELLGRFERYEVERVLGSGGMGIVLKGYDTDLHRVVAIKVLAPHLAHRGTARARFAREAQAAAAVMHPNVIQIHNVESESKVPYLVMQYVPGESLQRRVDYHGPLPVLDSMRIGLQVAAGLSAAHAQGLVHRDVKPANILLEESVERVLLSDFGLARAVDDASLTKTGIVAGTPFYMSPEQAFGQGIDHRSDLFSLGSVLYFILAGRPPFRASGAMAVLHRICQTPHRPIQDINPEVPGELADLIDRCLEKDPQKRFQSADQLHSRLTELLAAFQAGQLSLPIAPPVQEFPRESSSVRSKKLLGSVAVVAAAALLCSFGFFARDLSSWWAESSNANNQSSLDSGWPKDHPPQKTQPVLPNQASNLSQGLMGELPLEPLPSLDGKVASDASDAEAEYRSERMIQLLMDLGQADAIRRGVPLINILQGEPLDEAAMQIQQELLRIENASPMLPSFESSSPDGFDAHSLRLPDGVFS
ncbi:MAG: serine/threonine-protein kinase, partial [Planctomycetota bacterium]